MHNDNLGFFSSITRQDLSERDQLASKESFAAFKELVTRFPDSRYSTDAALRVVRDIADRTDCAGRQVRNNVVTVVVPIQNPDGRWLGYRRNSYGFDMNRDWFARTQAETDGKVQLMRKYPPVLDIDAHEMGSKGFFFPPDADPVYHEIADRSIDWINNLYGASMADEFDSRGLRYFNYSTYDMFYIGYGDTVPTEGFLSAGMTFEKDGYDPVGQRVRQQYIAAWTSISAPLSATVTCSRVMRARYQVGMAAASAKGSSKCSTRLGRSSIAAGSTMNSNFTGGIGRSSL